MKNEPKPTQVLPHLFLGGKADAKSKTTLQSFKIKYVMNCTPPKSVDPITGCPNYFEKEQSFKYCRVPMFDNKGEDLLSHLSKCHQFIEEGKHYGGVLVHCHKGVSRSAAVVASYLMKHNEMTVDEAIAYLQMVRPVVSPNPSFLEQLRQYESQLASARRELGDSLDTDVKVSGPQSPPTTVTSTHLEEDEGRPEKESRKRELNQIEDAARVNVTSNEQQQEDGSNDAVVKKTRNEG